MCKPVGVAFMVRFAIRALFGKGLLRAGAVGVDAPPGTDICRRLRAAEALTALRQSRVDLTGEESVEAQPPPSPPAAELPAGSEAAYWDAVLMLQEFANHWCGARGLAHEQTVRAMINRYRRNLRCNEKRGATQSVASLSTEASGH